MKQGRTLTAMAQELERQVEAKADFSVDTRHLELSTDGGGQSVLRTSGGEIGDAPVLDVPHEQIAERLGVPKKFYDRLRSNHPDMFDYTVNNLLHREPEQRMVRTLDGQARAFLSNKYRRIDNYEVLQGIIPILQQDTSLQVASCEVTDRKMYLKCVTPRVQGEIAEGDVVQSGIVISNSEVGLGKVRVAPLVHTLACNNGMVVERYGKGKYHVGKALETEEDVEQLLSDEARAQDDKALMLKLRDIVQGAMSQEVFDQILDDLRKTREREVESPTKAVEKLCQKFNMVRAKDDLTQSFFEAAPRTGYTQYGLLNAVTAYAQQVDDYDKATEIESLGGKIIDLNKAEWKEIATAE